MSSRYYCNHCNKSFGSDIALEQHFRFSAAHSAIRLMCPCCPTEFIYEEQRDAHIMETHHPCRWCKQAFVQEDECMMHMMEIHTYCGPCGKMFIDQKGLRDHMLKQHPGSCPIKCICNRTFSSLSLMVQHIENMSCSDISEHMFHHVLILMQSEHAMSIEDIADALYSSTRTLENWIMGEAFKPRRDPEVYACLTCKLQYARRTLLARHLYQHLNIQMERRVRCDGCQNVFDSYTGLFRHKESGSCAGGHGGAQTGEVVTSGPQRRR